MRMLRDISAVNKQHLVSFIKARYTVVSWGVRGDPRDDDGHALVGPALDVEPEAALLIRDHPEGNQTLSIKETIAIRLENRKRKKKYSFTCWYFSCCIVICCFFSPFGKMTTVLTPSFRSCLFQNHPFLKHRKV